MDSITPSQPSKLLDQLRERIRYRHYSLRTEQAYVHWAKRLPVVLTPAEVRRVLDRVNNQTHQLMADGAPALWDGNAFDGVRSPAGGRRVRSPLDG